MNRLQAGIIASHVCTVQNAESQEQAHRIAAALWPTVALAYPADARVARDVLTQAAEEWSKAVAS